VFCVSLFCCCFFVCCLHSTTTIPRAQTDTHRFCSVLRESLCRSALSRSPFDPPTGKPLTPTHPSTAKSIPSQPDRHTLPHTLLVSFYLLPSFSLVSGASHITDTPSVPSLVPLPRCFLSLPVFSSLFLRHYTTHYSPIGSVNLSTLALLALSFLGWCTLP